MQTSSANWTNFQISGTIPFMAKILILNGPNLNLLGTREPEIYGTQSLDQLNTSLLHQALSLGHELQSVQSNAEHQLIDKIQQAKSQGYQVVIINPAALAHTSIALRDAIVAAGLPTIEVHLTNIYAREPFRHHSYLTDVCVGSIQGFGANSYHLALQAADHILSQP
jgi:3-dehydroquinate dehydratase-2